MPKRESPKRAGTDDILTCKGAPLHHRSLASDLSCCTLKLLRTRGGQYDSVLQGVWQKPVICLFQVAELNVGVYESSIRSFDAVLPCNVGHVRALPAWGTSTTVLHASYCHLLIGGSFLGFPPDLRVDELSWWWWLSNVNGRMRTCGCRWLLSSVNGRMRTCGCRWWLSRM